MENNIIAIKAQLEMTDLLLEQERVALLEKVEFVLNKYIVSPHDAKLLRKSIRTEYGDNISIQFEVGFWNNEEQRVDFGSDLWGDFCTDKNKLRINYGTCGSYDSSETYQVRRVRLIADIWKNIEAIEAELLEITTIAQYRYRALVNERDDYHYQLSQIEAKQAENELREIEESLCVGDVLTYDESVSYRYRLFKDHVDTWRIIRVCDKTIKIKPDNFDEVRQLPKNKIVSLIKNNKLHVNKKES